MATISLSAGYDCEFHHQQMPSPEIIIPDRERKAAAESPDRHVLMRNSYDAEQLEGAVNAITKRPRTETTSRELGLEYEFVTDFLSVQTVDNLTPQELHDFFHNLMVKTDEYFFQGGLTQGPERHVHLAVIDQSNIADRGFFTPVKYTASRIVVYTRHNNTGKRRTKHDILSTLVHELVHAYLGMFFNFCPKGNVDLVLADGGHGEVWQRILLSIYDHMGKWDFTLANLDVREPAPVGGTFFFRYYAEARNMKSIRREWEVTNLRWYEPDIFRYWWWKPTPKEQFKRALLRLSYDSYEHFVARRVAYPDLPYRILIGIVLLGSCLLVFLIGLFLISLGKRANRLLRSMTTTLFSSLLSV
ncbi:hypothetical protein F4859DRAFT_348320 [Xylaria cf. heliscus]|nr:hypothetical protein F4859DRAFT_348320 [Xylaria cf. heliscus]